MMNFLYAARPLALDFLGTIFLVILLALKVDVSVAASIGIATTIATVLGYLALKKPVPRLQWMSLALVLSAGVASLITHDPRFLMAKATVVAAIVGWVMLERGWMLRYVPPIARGKVDDVMITFGYVWSGSMFLKGALNLIVAIFFPQYWIGFVAIVPTTMMVSLFAVQYIIVRSVAKRRIIAERSALVAA